MHVLRGDLTLGLCYLEYPRCIMWYQPEEFGHCFQWIDTDVSINDHNRVKLLLEMKDMEIAYSGANLVPMIDYNHLQLKQINL